MPQLTQDERMVVLHTPLGKDVLVLAGFEGRESLSALFEFQVDVLSEDHDIPFESIVGETVAISMMLADGAERYFNGIVSEFSQGRGGGDTAGSDPLYSAYSMRLVPWPWLLTRTTDSRIFQEMTVPDIIEKIFTEKGFTDYANRLTESYVPRTYCVQYRETDFDFISRLMEAEGIHYFFEHEKDKHVLVLADAGTEHQPCPHQKEAKYQISAGGWLDEDVITSFEVKKQIQPSKYTLIDYNFEVPSTNLKVEAPARTVLGRGEREIYDYPGGYLKRDLGDAYAKKRMEALEAQITILRGESDCRAFVTGTRFKIMEFYRSDADRKEYALLEIVHRYTAGGNFLAGSGGGGGDDAYTNAFVCIPHDVPFRPLVKTPIPMIRGAQTAIVTGPGGEEIYTDEHGRVKVQFHWDREGKRDENTSCWIRVSHGWAGAGWGAIYIPRIGQEVIVSFIEGDPDRPIITGRVYHGANKPPYGLPGEKTKSTLKSNSSLGGGGYNELRFEDKKGQEEIFLHGQKDWNIVIENDKNQSVGHDETLFVGHDQTISIGNNRDKTVGVNQTEKIGVNKTITVGSNHTETIGANMTQTVGVAKVETIGAAKTLTIGAAYQVSIGAAMNTTVAATKSEQVGAAKSVAVGADSSEDVGADKSINAGSDISQSAGKNVSVSSGKKMALTAGDDFSVSGSKKGVIDIKDQITIRCGKASITMKKNGDIIIKGKDINVKGSGNIVMKAKKILEN